MKVALYSLVHDEASLKIVTEIVAFFTSEGAGIQMEKELFFYQTRLDQQRK